MSILKIKRWPKIKIQLRRQAIESLLRYKLDCHKSRSGIQMYCWLLVDTEPNTPTTTLWQTISNLQIMNVLPSQTTKKKRSKTTPKWNTPGKFSRRVHQWRNRTREDIFSQENTLSVQVQAWIGGRADAKRCQHGDNDQACYRATPSGSRETLVSLWDERRTNGEQWKRSGWRHHLAWRTRKWRAKRDVMQASDFLSVFAVKLKRKGTKNASDRR